MEMDTRAARSPAAPLLERVRARVSRVPYPMVCLLLGLVVGWLPRLLHGPHPGKFALLYIHGQIAVTGFYAARLMIGLLVGITAWPRPWFLRGPLCGFLSMLPVALIALATPGCEYT